MDSPSPILARLHRFEATTNVAVRDAEGAHTFRSIGERARGVAVALLAGRASFEGERVALLVSPGAGFVEALFGVLLAGGCAVILSPLHPAAETTYFCDDAEVKALIASRDLAPRLDTLRSGRTLFVTDEPRPACPPGVLPTPRAGEAALQLYTSGTTGKPKGAVLTHGNLGTHQELLAHVWGHTEGDVLLHALPLHHLHGLGIAMLAVLGAGGATHLLPHFDAAALWEGMREATLFMGVPTMYTKLLAAFDAASEETRARWAEGARGLRLATSGSAALPVTTGERWRAITGSYPLERFGMTEIGVGMTNPVRGPRKPGSVGKPLPTVETRIVGEDGNDAASGELWVRGPSVFASYWRREAATRDAFVGEGPARWFRTGDTVTRDESGDFRVLGRTSVDILKSGGYKLSALEIEEVLREHPAVLEVAVVGLPDETWGERVVACVIARAGAEGDCDEAALRAFAKTRLASYKVPKTVVTMTDLPRNPIGKVVKPELVKLLRARGA